MKLLITTTPYIILLLVGSTPLDNQQYLLNFRYPYHFGCQNIDFVKSISPHVLPIYRRSRGVLNFTFTIFFVMAVALVSLF